MPAGDLPHLSRAALRELDRLAVEELGIPSVVLMENAGRGAAESILARLGAARGEGEAQVAVLCGRGNNGGDGYVAARHLANAGARVLLCETREPGELSPDAAVFRRVTWAMGLEHVRVHGAAELDALRPRLQAARVLVDALLGTGARGELSPPLAELVEAANELARAGQSREAGPELVALDVPSGLDADTGAPARATIRAARTLTFAAPKLGFLAARAAPYLGRVEVLSIGTPPALAHRLAADGPGAAAEASFT